jgi:hypothetical protein
VAAAQSRTALVWRLPCAGLAGRTLGRCSGRLWPQHAQCAAVCRGCPPRKLARGGSASAPGIVGGAGYLTGSETLTGAADDTDAALAEWMPINPANEGVGTTIAGGVGQAANILATAGLGGLAGKGLQIARGVQAGAQAASLGAGILQGARSGGQMADERGLTGAERVLAIGGTAALEMLTEKLPFVQVTETGAVRRLLGDAVDAAPTRFTSDVFSEVLEEQAAQVGSNALENVVAQEGQEAPGLLDAARWHRRWCGGFCPGCGKRSDWKALW